MAEAMDGHYSLVSGIGGLPRSPASVPFAYDWGVKLPTQFALYDEMRCGKPRKAVDARMIEASGGRPISGQYTECGQTAPAKILSGFLRERADAIAQVEVIVIEVALGQHAPPRHGQVLNDAV